MTDMKSTLLNPSLTSQPGVGASFPKMPTRITSENPLSEADVIPEVIERLETLGTNLAAVHRVCSEAYATQGKYDEALMHMKIACSMDDKDLEYRNQRGFLYYLCGYDVEATQDFLYVVQHDASNVEAFFNLGMVQFGLSRYLEAEQCFANACQLVPDDAELWNNLGVARYHLGRVKDALACIQRAIEIDPDYEDAQNNLRDLS